MQKIRNIRVYLSLFAMIIGLSVATPVVAQTVEIGIEDLKQLRKIAADAVFEKARADEAERQSVAWQTSSTKWKALYESEKDRADRVQEGRVNELLKANAAYKDQAAADKQRLGELEFDIRKLKSGRKWWFAAGAVTGAAAGAYAGYKLGGSSITIVQPNTNQFTQFRASFNF